MVSPRNNNYGPNSGKNTTNVSRAEDKKTPNQQKTQPVSNNISINNYGYKPPGNKPQVQNDQNDNLRKVNSAANLIQNKPSTKTNNSGMTSPRAMNNVTSEKTLPSSTSVNQKVAGKSKQEIKEISLKSNILTLSLKKIIASKCLIAFQKIFDTYERKSQILK